MLVHHLASVDGEIVVDMDPAVVGPAVGGTRVTDAVTVDELAVLARARTYTFAVFEQRLGGAAAGIRPRLLDTRADTLARYRDEVLPLIEAGWFRPGVDLGSTPEDLVGILAGTEEHPVRNGRMDARVDGESLAAVAVGRGVMAAAQAWRAPEGGVEAATVAIDGFDDVGAAVARDAARRGGRIVAVSTDRGAVAQSSGFELGELVEAREAYGDEFVQHLGLEVHRSGELHELPVDVLVSGARTGRYDEAMAERVQARLVVPASPGAYTEKGLERLRRRQVMALPDFVCSGGSWVAAAAPRGLPDREILDRVDRLVAERIESARLAKIDPIRYAVTLADTFLVTWVPADRRPDGPAFAPEPLPSA